MYRELANGTRVLVPECAHIIAKGSRYQSASYRCFDVQKSAVRYVLEEVTRAGVSTFFTLPNAYDEQFLLASTV